MKPERESSLLRSELSLGAPSRIEGPSYKEMQPRIRVRNEAGEEVEAITFVVKEASRQPGLWTSAAHVGHIIRGLRQHGVPEPHVQHVFDAAIQDNQKANDQPSARRENALIESLRKTDTAWNLCH